MGDDTISILPGADWVDRFAGEIGDRQLQSREAVEALFARPPAWISQLMTMRNVIVRPLGLRTVQMTMADSVGGFPVLSSSSTRTVLGFDDWHLDFRIVVDLIGTAEHTNPILSVTTLVRRKSIFGRAYLTFVGPFHRRIVPTMMARICSNPRPVAIA